jgi:hypothetical protein
MRPPTRRGSALATSSRWSSSDAERPTPDDNRTHLPMSARHSAHKDAVDLGSPDSSARVRVQEHAPLCNPVARQVAGHRHPTRERRLGP